MKIRPAAVLAVLALGLIAARFHTYREPPERDVATYAVIGHELLNGRSLYIDLWDNKPPAIYLAFAMSEAVAGYGPREIFLINILAALLGLVGCYFAGAAIGSAVAGLVAAGLWALTSGDLYLQGNQPNAELLINVCLLGFLAIVLAPSADKKGRGRRIIAAGLLAGAATLFKYTAIVPFVFVGGADLLAARSRKGAAIAASPGEWMAISGVVAAMWVVVCLGVKNFQAFLDVVFRFNFHYAASGGGSLAGVSLPVKLISALSILVYDPALISLTLPLIAPCLVGAVAGLRTGQRRFWILWIALTAGILSEIAIPGHFYAHYFQLMLPAWALGTGWAFEWMVAALPPIAIWTGVALFGGMLLAREAPWYGLPAIEWSRLKYGDRFAGSPALSAEINQALQPGETFYNWGNDPELYFETGRRPPTGMFLQYPLAREPFLDRSNARVIADLERARPELVVISKYTVEPERPGLPIVAWLRQNYAPYPDGGDRGAFLLLARKRGPLERRLKSRRP
jgi:hypothetical protein